MTAIEAIITAINQQKTTARQSVETALARAAEVDEYNAIISLTSERALDRADEIDQAIAAGTASGRLLGVPFIVKDNILTFGAPTTAGSRILENFTTPIQATAIEKLEAEGAICIGKANLDAFGHGGSTENSAFGPTKNSHDKQLVAGGSSGGSAVVTALDVVPFALGTDTGGSIRQPASFNGIYGIKPTYGAVSRYGVVAMASSTDTVGCFTTSASDMELIIDIISGRDQHDATTLPDYFSPQSDTSSKRKIAVITETLTEDVAPEVRRSISGYIDQLTKAGHQVEEVSMPIVKHALAMYYIIVPAEISSNLARYDGVRYGVAAQSTSLAELYGRSRDSGFEAENKRRIMIGSYVLSSGYYDAYYQQAQKARTLLIEAYQKIFEDYDLLLTPTAPTTAFKIGANSHDPVKMYLADTMTVPPSLAGLPAVSLPIKTEDGVPVGVQLIANQRQDAELIGFIKSMEAAK